MKTRTDQLKNTSQNKFNKIASVFLPEKTPLDLATDLPLEDRVFISFEGKKTDIGIEIIKDRDEKISVIMTRDIDSGFSNLLNRKPEAMAQLITYKYNLNPENVTWYLKTGPGVLKNKFEGEVSKITFENIGKTDINDPYIFSYPEWEDL